MTVQELIDELMKVPDKSKLISCYDSHFEGYIEVTTCFEMETEVHLETDFS